MCFRTELTTKIWMKIDPYKICSAMTEVSGNLGLCGYSRAFLGDEASNDGAVIENVDFQGFRTLRLRHLRKWGEHYYTVLSLVPFHSPQNTSSNDLELPFTLNFHYTNSRWEIILQTYCRVCLHTWPAEMCGSGPWSAEYLGSAEKLRIFRRRCIVGTLTNKANISI